MTVDEAHDAVRHAQEMIDGCESADELDEISDYDTAVKDCPDHFSQEQRDLAQRILCDAMMKSIGRC